MSYNEIRFSPPINYMFLMIYICFFMYSSLILLNWYCVKQHVMESFILHGLDFVWHQ